MNSRHFSNFESSKANGIEDNGNDKHKTIVISHISFRQAMKHIDQR